MPDATKAGILSKNASEKLLDAINNVEQVCDLF